MSRASWMHLKPLATRTKPSAATPSRLPLFFRSYPPMSENFKSALIWLLGSTVALAVVIYHIPAVLVDGEFIPFAVDSFYHARRVLETLADPAHRLWEFDRRSYAPKGTWHTWPWLYDWLLIQVAVIGMAVSGIQNPLAILTYVPPLFATVNTGLILLIAQRLKFSRILQILAVLAFAASPMTLHLHAPGRIDHHFMELSCVLATLLTGLSWFQRMDDPRRALLLGIVVGIAPGIQNGLFILQLPILLTVAVLWVRRMPRPDIKAANGFSLGLAGTTIAILLPSAPFWDGQFFYYTLSWFHLYIAACVVFTVQFLARIAPSRKSMVWLLLAALALLLFVMEQVYSGFGFVGGSTVRLAGLHSAEGVSLYETYQTKGLRPILDSYSLLFLSLPVTLLILIRWPFMQADQDRIFFAFMALGGGVLLSAMIRLHYFGSFILIFGPLLGWHWLMNRFTGRTNVLAGILVILMLGAHYPVFPNLTKRSPVGGTILYTINREIFSVMEKECAKQPGIILAHPNDGHFITFHTACSVLSNNMALTAQQAAAYRLTKDLLLGPPRDIREKHPEITYVYAYGTDSQRYALHSGLPGGKSEKMMAPAFFLGSPPEGFELLKELRLPYAPGAPFSHSAKFYRVTRE